ncbi:MAG: carboxy terminal-processing peptidase [Verrucomicrobiota bacterium]|nr:carboxy terminal-processing peptidase [Verrucomicrobiota bacterium]
MTTHPLHKKSLFDIAFLTLIFLACSPNLQSKNELQPTALMKHETKWLVEALEKAHYSKVSIKNLDRDGFIDHYLQKLDNQKLYFIKSEVEGFKKSYEPTLVTYFEQGNLFPGFEIYNSYKSNSLERIKWAIEFLTEYPNLDSNRTYAPDRTELDWASSVKELDETWKNLITFEFLNETLAKLDTNKTLDDISDSNLTAAKQESQKVLLKRYSRWQKNLEEFEAGDVQELYLTALTQMFDPHTTFMNLKEKEKFDQQMNNEFVGIGARLSDEDGYCTIKGLLPGGPAEASRELETNDIILKVAQSDGDFVDVVDMKLPKIVELIKGPKDTVVRLEIRPVNNPSTSKVVSIIRDKIKLTENLASGKIHQVQNGKTIKRIGVIELPSFYGSSGNGPKATDDVEEIISKFKNSGIEGIILDLRRNGGGYLSEAVNLAGLFISRGPVVQVKNTDGSIRKKFDFNPKLAWNGPLAILVSRFSASASEIVAGALKNHSRAIIIGDPTTHGKGTVQSLIQMNLPFNFNHANIKKSAAKITIQKYYLPSGSSTQIYGVESDIVMPTINTFRPIGESDLDYALKSDTIPPVNSRRPQNEFVYDIHNLMKLKEFSQKRQNTYEEFDYLNDSVEWFKQKQKEKVMSLNLSERLIKRKSDELKNDELNDIYESFSEKSFPEQEIVLNIVQQQKEKSLIARGESLEGDVDNNESFQKPENLDIRLTESLRIVWDWIDIRDGTNLSKKPNPTEI